MSDGVPPEIRAFIDSQLSELKGQVQSKDEDLAQLRSQLAEMKVEKKSKPSSSSRKVTTTTSEETVLRSKASTSRTSKNSAETPVKSSSQSRSTPVRSRSTPVQSASKSKSSKTVKPPTPKRHPCQIQERELPPGFKGVKDALFLTIRVLWGMTERGAVPQAPDRKTLKEFYARFNSAAEIECAADNMGALALIAQEEITTLKDARLRQKAARGTLQLQEIHIMFIHATLAKLGLRRWSPDLTESTDSLLNCACRISAISAFRQVAAGAAFDSMNLDKDYINDVPRLIRVYDHYVHFLMATRFNREQKKAGAFAEEAARKSAQTGRKRLRDHRLNFARDMKYPDRYIEILSDIAAHSDDEPSKDDSFWIVKKLGYRSDIS